MIAYVKGTVEYTEPESGLVVLENQGMGYNILIPGKEFSLLPSYGEEVKLYTHLNVREDAMQLFGFLTRDDLVFFRLLIGVNGIGPKAALGILSVFGADELRFAILANDVKTISKAPGVGAKTASKLILELKDKISLEDAFEKKFTEKETVSGESGKNTNADEAVQALVALGYSSTDALRAIRKVEGAKQMDVEDILKAALKHLSFM